MGWFGDWQKSRELSQARKVMNAARSPYSISVFVDRAIELEKLDGGLSEVEAALQEFPNSECLQSCFRKLIKRKAKDEIQHHRKALRTEPNGHIYYELAKLYKECGDYDQAIEFSRKGTIRYPDFEGNYIILGSIRYERFQRDLRKTDGERAIELLEKACDLNRENYRLLKQLAEIYLAVGAREQAIEKLNDIIHFAPDDATALKLIGQAHKLKSSTDGRSVSEILTEFERRAELHSKLKNQGIGRRGQRYLRNPRELQDKLRLLEQRVANFERVVVLTPQGDLLAAHPSDTSVKNYAGVLKECFEAALECTLKMDISTFEKGLFETEKGLTYLLVFDRLQLALYTGLSARREDLIEEIHKFLEHELYL